MMLLFYSASVFVIVTTAITFVKSTHWLVRVFDFPRLQLLIIGSTTLLYGICIAKSFSALDFIVLLILLFSTAYQAKKVIPFISLYPFESVPDDDEHPTSDEGLGVMVANVLMTNRNVKALLSQIDVQLPDILLTVETDSWWEKELSLLHEAYPYRVNCPKDNLYGMHLYSKYALKDYSIEYLIENDIPSIHATAILNSGQEIKLFCVHPAPPSPTENTYSDERDRELILISNLVAREERACIVFGDLNDVAWSRTTRKFKEISALKDPRVGRGMFSSYNAKYWPLRWPLDHIFHSDDFALSKIKRLRYFGSDHFPLYVELKFIATDKSA